MNSRALRLVLRGLAILIAVAGVVDPAITSNRASKARVAVVATDNSRDSALARRASRSLGKRFMVIDAPLSATDATVLIGDRLPRGFRELSTPIFAVEGDSTETHIAIEAVRSPTVAPLDARVPVAVAARARGARGRMLDVILTSNGVVVDRTSRPISADDQVGATLSFVPTAAGTAPLRVSATIAGTKDTASADVVTDIRQTRWPVLFFDPHPSWMSTFVRRAVERDPRFVVTSRVVTSRNVSTDAGNPPSRLDDLVGTERFDAIVVGTPDALSDQDIAGLEDFARRRGGSIVFLYDQRSTGKSARLTHATAWAMRTNRTPVPIVRKSVASGGTPDTSLLATEIAWPQPLPSNVDVLARTVAAARDSSANRVVLWRAPVGAGRVIVSTALDAWRFRDRAQSSFDRLWQSVIADAASEQVQEVAS